MLQSDVNRAVARATGESVGTIAALGFSFIEAPYDPDLDRDPLTVDWDDVESSRWAA